MNGIKFKRLSIILLIFVLASGGIFSATTVTLRLTGTVASVTSISINIPIVDFGIFTEAAVVDNHIATITEISNSTSGFIVTLTTNNGNTSGLLTEVGGDSIPYTIKYNGVPVSFESGTFEVTNSTNFSNNAELKFVTISYDIDDITVLNVGTYTDTLTFLMASQ
jgi:hypothetical protein